jgi:hypothetical protein
MSRGGLDEYVGCEGIHQLWRVFPFINVSAGPSQGEDTNSTDQQRLSSGRSVQLEVLSLHRNCQLQRFSHFTLSLIFSKECYHRLEKGSSESTLISAYGHRRLELSLNRPTFTRSRTANHRMLSSKLINSLTPASISRCTPTANRYESTPDDNPLRGFYVYNLFFWFHPHKNELEA